MDYDKFKLITSESDNTWAITYSFEKEDGKLHGFGEKSEKELNVDNVIDLINTVNETVMHAKEKYLKG